MAKVTKEIEQAIIENYYTKTTREIGEMFGVKLNTANVNTVVKRHGMNLKQDLNGHNLRYFFKEIAEMANKGYTNIHIKKELGLKCSLSLLSLFRKQNNLPKGPCYQIMDPNTAEIVKKMYIEDKMSCKEVGDCLGIKDATVYEYLKKRGLQRSEAEAMEFARHKRAGEKSVNWKGGYTVSRSGKSYPWSSVFKASILERDLFKCALCKKNNCDELFEINRSLAIHHIIPYRLIKDNNPWNLISLCCKCHKTVEHKTTDELIDCFNTIPNTELIEFFITIFCKDFMISGAD